MISGVNDVLPAVGAVAVLLGAPWFVVPFGEGRLIGNWSPHGASYSSGSEALSPTRFSSPSLNSVGSAGLYDGQPNFVNPLTGSRAKDAQAACMYAINSSSSIVFTLLFWAGPGAVLKTIGTSLPWYAPEFGSVVRFVLENTPNHRYRQVGTSWDTEALARMAAGQVQRCSL